MDPILSAFDRQFLALDARSRELLALLSDATLFQKLTSSGSCGEFILRSAATVEQTFGGITTHLWDDPMEWTLPEKLADHASIRDYLDEVEVTRQNGFAFFASDADLTREIPAPET